MPEEIWLGPSAFYLFNFRSVTVKDIQNVTNWRNAFFHHPAPYLTDKGFPNPLCSSGDGSLRHRGALGVSRDEQPMMRSNHSAAGTYVIGGNDDCVKENSSNNLCNGPLKPNTVYVWVQARTRQKVSHLCGNVTDCCSPGSSSELQTLEASRQTQIILSTSKQEVIFIILFSKDKHFQCKCCCFVCNLWSA